MIQFDSKKIFPFPLAFPIVSRANSEITLCERPGPDPPSSLHDRLSMNVLLDVGASLTMPYGKLTDSTQQEDHERKGSCRGHVRVSGSGSGLYLPRLPLPPSVQVGSHHLPSYCTYMLTPYILALLSYLVFLRV